MHAASLCPVLSDPLRLAAKHKTGEKQVRLGIGGKTSVGQRLQSLLCGNSGGSAADPGDAAALNGHN